MGVDRAVVERGDGGVVGEFHQVGRGEILGRIDLLQRALDHAEALAGELAGIGELRIGGQDRQVAGQIAVGEVDRLLARLGGADRRHRHVEAAIGDRWHQGGELLAGEDDLVLLEADPLGDVENSSMSKPVNCPSAVMKV